MRRLLLVVGGAVGALFGYAVYRNSVAFPRALRSAGEKIQRDVTDMREFHDRMDRLGLTAEQRQLVSQGYLWARGYRANCVGPTR